MKRYLLPPLFAAGFILIVLLVVSFTPAIPV